MAKAKWTLPNGTKVDIDGSAEEVAKLMSLLTTGMQDKKGATGSKKARPSKGKGKKPKTGPKPLIVDLIDAGFFKARQSIKDIQKKLEAQGHIYAQSSLSPALQRLVREKLLNRVKVEGLWYYENP